MTELQYVRLLGEAPKIYFDSFNQTQRPRHAAQFLASVRDIKRLKPEWHAQIELLLGEAEQLAATLPIDMLRGAAERFDLSGYSTRLESLESLREADLDHEDRSVFAYLAFEELIEVRDQIHLAIMEFEDRGLLIPYEIRKSLKNYDKRSQSNEIIRLAISSPRPYVDLYDPSALRELWWWDNNFKFPQTYRAAKEWLAAVADWISQTPSPALVPVTRTTGNQINSAGPMWKIGDAFDAEISAFPLGNQLWLCFSGKSVQDLQLSSLIIDTKVIATQIHRHGKELLLIPMGVLGFQRVDIKILCRHVPHDFSLIFQP